MTHPFMTTFRVLLRLPQLLIDFPYLGVISDKIRSSHYKILSKNLPCCKFNIIFKASSRLSTYFRFKDRPCKDLISGIVYQFSCGGCNDTYIGQSKHHLKARNSEHIGVSALTDKTSSSSAPLTAVQEHMLECDHRVCSEDFSILGHAKNAFLLELKESLFILRDNPVLNKNNTVCSVVLIQLVSTVWYLFHNW